MRKRYTKSITFIEIMNKPKDYITTIERWFTDKQWHIFDFQRDCWEAVLNGDDGILNAPTGSGKTLALWLPFVMKALAEKHLAMPKKKGIRLLWITPLRALARDTEQSLAKSAADFGISWQVGRRTGDNSAAERNKIKKNPPEVLITTPETLHLYLSQRDYPALFRNLDGIVVDEWHELMGTKRGVQSEIAIEHLRSVQPNIQLWGISATIGNISEAGKSLGISDEGKLIRAEVRKETQIKTLLPETVDNFPWAGHIGLKLLPKLLPVIRESRSVLLFTNTRSMTEIWYQNILAAAPELAGLIAIHHGSLDQATRNWVESSLHSGALKLVICTSSLDLGVDFAPVQTVVQIGSPKGVARFMQRAGRSGHQPGSVSTIYMVPTHALEILDAIAIQQAVRSGQIENRAAMYKPLDVLVQFVCTLATGVGCNSDEVYEQMVRTETYRNLSRAEWEWVVTFVTSGGQVLQKYDDYTKVRIADDGILHIVSRKIAMRHRLSIGTITSDANLKVKFLKGGYLGTVEESFVSRLKPGDIMLFAGRYLEFVRLNDLTVLVRKSAAKKGAVSKWMGGRMPLSSYLADQIRTLLQNIDTPEILNYPERVSIHPLLETQKELSRLPEESGFLIEIIRSREGWHHYFYPIDGRTVHEGLASLIAWRIGRKTPISFSIAINDYGFELLSDQEVDESLLRDKTIYTDENLMADIKNGINAAEMAKRQFREIARVSGLTFQGYPGKRVQNKHLQANASLLFDVFEQYEPDNLLVKQAYDEIIRQQIDEVRLRKTLQRIQENDIIITRPNRFTPFSFPIMTDRLRSKMSSEKLEDRIRKMYLKLTAG